MNSFRHMFVIGMVLLMFSLMLLLAVGARRLSPDSDIPQELRRSTGPPRMVIYGDHSTSSLVELVEVALSDGIELRIVGGDRRAAWFQHLRGQAPEIGFDHDTAIEPIEPADIALFIKETPEPSHDVLVRLVSIDDGIILFQHREAWPIFDLDRWQKSVRFRVAASLRNMKRPPGRGLRVTVLPVRAGVTSHGHQQIEVELHRQLLHQLS